MPLRWFRIATICKSRRERLVRPETTRSVELSALLSNEESVLSMRFSCAIRIAFDTISRAPERLLITDNAKTLAWVPKKDWRRRARRRAAGLPMAAAGGEG
eukprot:4169239-Pleurochrysis_carterae.AAC.1